MKELPVLLCSDVMANTEREDKLLYRGRGVGSNLKVQRPSAGSILR